MRIRPLLALFALVAVAAGCQTSSEPERREILGSWRSSGVSGLTIEMTLAETSRSVDGAGAWIAEGFAEGFVVRGALARDEVSLNFEFGEEIQSVNFQGYFRDGDVILGTLNGRGYNDGAVTFTRVDLSPD